MKQNLRYCFLLIVLTMPLCTYAGWPVGKYRNLVVPSFNYYTANNTFNAQGNKVKGAAGSGFQSYALNFYYARVLPAGLDLIVTLPYVYQQIKVLALPIVQTA